MHDSPLKALEPFLERSGELLEISTEVAATHAAHLPMIDVREPHELHGPEGMLDGVEHLPMGDLAATVHHFDPQAPLLLLCRSGGRTANLAAAMTRHGFQHVISVRGGMLAWNAEQLPRDQSARPRAVRVPDDSTSHTR